MRACVDAGLTPRLFVTGGGSDANVLASAGLQTVALSCGMEGVHGTSESIEVANLTALAELCVAVARHVGRGA
jgi:tripeptide aminopeptidase